MKVTTEKLPKSLLALDIELERDQVEKGLDRAARRLSQKYTIPGFRKGKAPRFIIENYFGREALLEEASEDLVNKAYKEALKRENLVPVGPANLESIDPAETFRIRVTVPIPPTVTLPDYRAIRVPLEIEPVTDEVFARSMDMLREKHVVLKELEELRPAKQGDQLTVKLETLVDGTPLEQRNEEDELPESTLVLEPDRLVDELYEGLLGMEVDNTREISAQIPDDHANEQVQGKLVVFHVQLVGIQERLLPDWDELPTLEEFDGTLDELRDKTRADLETSTRNTAERQQIDTYVEQLVAQTEYDVPDVMFQEMAEDMLESQGQQFAQYGITLEQMLQYRGQTKEQALDDLLPEATHQLEVRLALREIVRSEHLDISDGEIEGEIQQILEDYQEEERENAAQLLAAQLRPSIANAMLTRKLHERLMTIASGEAPALPEPAATATEGGPVVIAGEDTHRVSETEAATEAASENQPHDASTEAAHIPNDTATVVAEKVPPTSEIDEVER